MLDLPHFDAKRHFLRATLLIHVDQRPAFGDIVQLFLVHARVVVRIVDHFQPHKADHNPQPAHKEEHMRPTHLMRQPAHDRRENNGGKVLGGVKNRYRCPPLLRREPGGDDPAVAGE